MALLALAWLVMLKPLEPLAQATLDSVAPEAVVMFLKVTSMVWLALAPTWNFMVWSEPPEPPLSTSLVLNCVISAMRLISSESCLNSASSEPRSVSVLVSLAD